MTGSAATRAWWPLPGALVWIIIRSRPDALAVVAQCSAKFKMRSRLHRYTPLRGADNKPVLNDQEFSLEEANEDAEALKAQMNADEAWHLLRDAIADGRVKARGRWVDRRLRSSRTICFQNTVAPSVEDIPAAAIEGYTLFDEEFGGETILRPESAVRMSGEGRYWRDVRIHQQELLDAFPASGADLRTAGTASAETACLKWLKTEAEAQPLSRPKTKEKYWAEAQRRFGSSLSYRAFVRSWRAATAVAPAWQQAGRPRINR